MTNSPPFILVTRYSSGRVATDKFHTVKSARHYAKALCNSPTALEITLEGPSLIRTVLFSRATV
jgi:hypothetical protein